MYSNSCEMENTGVGGLCLLRGIFPYPGIKPRSPALQADSSPADPPGKPKNAGVGSLSLLQQIFPTQESNLGLLHGRQILYQLSYQGSLIGTELKREYAKLPDHHNSKSCSSLHLHESFPHPPPHQNPVFKQLGRIYQMLLGNRKLM